MTDPLWGLRTCRECRDWATNEDGTFTERPSGSGKRFKRIPIENIIITPCFKCPKIPKGAPDIRSEYAVELTPQSLATYLHWRECKAVGDWPKNEDGEVDPIVKRNAGLLQDLMDSVKDMREGSTLQALITLAAWRQEKNSAGRRRN